MEHKSISKRTYLSVPSHGNEKYEFGVLHTFYYPVEGGGKIAVSTTRLETMLGDTAVAIHPNDPRHKVGGMTIMLMYVSNIMASLLFIHY